MKPETAKPYTEALLPFATSAQAKYLKAYIEAGSLRGAARICEVNPSTVTEALERLKANAALRGHMPSVDIDKPVPAPFVVKGFSNNYDAKGNLKQVWLKTNIDWQRRFELIQEAADSLAKDLPRLKPVKAPAARLPKDLVNVITMTDCHIGMYAWDQEGGDKWDMVEAERVLTGVFEKMIDDAPAAEKIVIAQLGDFLHYDSLEAVTPTSRHNLDASGRPGEMVKVAIRVLRRIVNKALATHKEVVLLVADGNHDLFSSMMLREMFKAWYEKEPRLTVINSASPFYAYQHGKVALFWHHSHLKKLNDLPLLFATQFKKIWGDTDFRFGHTGDKHHLEEKEHSGVVMLQHPTLAARDAYASRHGWHALRRAMLITYHSSFGEWGRRYWSPDMIEV
jgi:hypothetical protein